MAAALCASAWGGTNTDPRDSVVSQPGLLGQPTESSYLKICRQHLGTVSPHACTHTCTHTNEHSHTCIHANMRMNRMYKACLSKALYPGECSRKNFSVGLFVCLWFFPQVKRSRMPKALVLQTRKMGCHTESRRFCVVAGWPGFPHPHPLPLPLSLAHVWRKTPFSASQVWKGECL